MGIKTKIEWCDSTCNGMIGCDGCELWIPKAGIRDCYAGLTTERYAGKKGWPSAFNRPRHFPGRIEQALLWPDLTGTKRRDKPWLDGFPRTIFLDDMGDTFTENLSPRWLDAYVERMALAPHIWIFLTKRPRQMANYFRRIGDIPENFWLGTTVTHQATLGRLRDLSALRNIGTHDNILWCSFEPLMGSLEFSVYDGKGLFEATQSFVDDEPVDFDFAPLIDWAVVGGGSRMMRAIEQGAARDLLRWLDLLDIPTFFKQWGSLASNPDPKDLTARENGGYAKGGRLVDGRELNGMPRLDR